MSRTKKLLVLGSIVGILVMFGPGPLIAPGAMQREPKDC
jgi:hypothetical protein